MKRAVMTALRLAGAACVVGLAANVHAQSPAPAPQERWCRQGAFVDAMALINAAVRASRALPPASVAKNNVAAAELDSILSIAVQQAAAEYVCVKGKLKSGYDKNYADTVRLALAHATARKLAPKTQDAARALIAEIESSGFSAGK
ncbi:MAG: hypothetical protein ACRCV9_01580 [Burkholderiaceae bacterium]